MPELVGLWALLFGLWATESWSLVGHERSPSCVLMPDDSFHHGGVSVSPRPFLSLLNALPSPEHPEAFLLSESYAGRRDTVTTRNGSRWPISTPTNLTDRGHWVVISRLLGKRHCSATAAIRVQGHAQFPPFPEPEPRTYLLERDRQQSSDILFYPRATRSCPVHSQVP